MELCAAVIGCYVGWVLLAVYPRRTVRLSPRILQDIAMLVVTSLVSSQLLRHEILIAGVTSLVAYLLVSDLPSPWMTSRGKAVLITGCDQGLGHHLALHLDSLGMTVFAGVLFSRGPGAAALTSSASQRLVVLPLDVTDMAQVKAARCLLEDKLEGKGLHGVVNNAGVLLLGSLEVMGSDDIRKILDVNLSGVVNISRAFLPLIRRQRDEAPRLVNICSNVGLAPASQMGVYAASKAAVAMLTETLRYELSGMGIGVSMVVPSGYRTGILMYDKAKVATRWLEEADEEVKEFYGKDCFSPTNKTKNYVDYLAPDFSPLTSCIADALLAKQAKPVYYKGFLARSLPSLYLHLPAVLWTPVMSVLADYYHFPVKALQSISRSPGYTTQSGSPGYTTQSGSPGYTTQSGSLLDQKKNYSYITKDSYKKTSNFHSSDNMKED